MVKSKPGETRYYFHDPAGNVVWEYAQGASGLWDNFHFYFNGRLTAVQSATDGTLWTHLDHLGTPRIKTDIGGDIVYRSGQQVRDWYYPFGEQINAPVDSETRRFTGQERDFESGLDYFGARHYSPSLGRFMSPDQYPGGPVDAVSGAGPVVGPLPYADIRDPQSLNKFAYTLNNPLRYNDPDGHIAIAIPIIVGVAAIVGYLATDAYVKSPAGRKMTADVARVVEAAGSTATEFARDVGEGMVEATKGTSVHGVAGVDTGMDRRMLSYMSGETGDADSSDSERSFGDQVKDFNENPADWRRVSAHTESSTRRGGRKRGSSTQVIWENTRTGERIVEHIVTDDKGRVRDSHMRPNFKPSDEETGQ